MYEVTNGTRVVFQGDKHDILPQTVYESRCHGQLAGWLASLTLEDEVRPNLDLPRVVSEYEDVNGIASVEGCRLRYRVTPWYFAHLYDFA